MKLEADRPLSFGDDQDWWVSRSLQPYTAGFEPDVLDETISEQDLWKSLHEQSAPNYAILSARGTGKTSLLNWLRARAQQDRALLAVGPVALAGCHEDDTDVAMSRIWTRIVEAAQQHAGFHSSVQFQDDLAFSVGALLREAQAQSGAGRVLLLLDDFQELGLPVAFKLSMVLRDLCRGYPSVTLVLAGELALTELVTHEWSPLRGIVREYTLLDFEPADMRTLVAAFRSRMPDSSFDALGVRHIYELTRGYPYYIFLLLEYVATYSEPITVDPNLVDQIALRALKDERLLPVQAAREVITRMAQGQGPVENHAPLENVCHLLEGEEVLFDGNPEAEVLALRGVIRRQRNGKMGWRNPLVECDMDYHRAELIALLNTLVRGESALRGSGRIYVSLVMDLRRYVREEDRLCFDQIRGSDDYVETLRDLANQVQAHGPGPFRVMEEEDTLHATAADLGIFHHALVQNAFMPIYELAGSGDEGRPVLFPTNESRAGRTTGRQYDDTMERHWGKWNRMSLQLTRDGTVHVRLEKKLLVQPLPDWVRHILGLGEEIASEEGSEGTGSPGRPSSEPALQEVQWEIARILVEWFIKTHLQYDGGFALGLPNATTIQLAPPSAWSQESKHVHDRYIIFAFDQLCFCGEYCQILSANELLGSDEYTRELGCLLEGVMIKEQRVAKFPEFKVQEAAELVQQDLSSWAGELCLLTEDNAVIYYQSVKKREDNEPVLRTCPHRHVPLSEKIVRLHFPQRPVSYQDYWRSIIRGLEYLVELRLLGLLVAAETTGGVASLAGFLSDKEQKKDETGPFQQQATAMTRLLSHLRDASIPRFIGSADYATRKFTFFSRMSGLNETIEHSASNLQEINSLLEYIEDRRMQNDARRASGLYSLVALALSLISFSSVTYDAYQLTRAVQNQEGGAIIFVALDILLALISLVIVSGIVYKYWLKGAVRRIYRFAKQLAAKWLAARPDHPNGSN